MKPMDIGTLLPRSTEVARNRGVEQQRPATTQQQFAAEVQRQVQHKRQTVVRSEAAEKAKIGQDRGKAPGRDRGGQGKARRAARAAGGRGAAAAKAAAGRESPEGRGRLVDIVLGGDDSHGE